MDLKGRIYSATIRAVLLYGSQTWPIPKEELTRLPVFHSRRLRPVARVWWETHGD